MKSLRHETSAGSVRCAACESLVRIGYSATRQTGGHLRLTTASPSEHHVTVPVHDSLKVGTLAAILADVAAHQKISRDELLNRIFG